MYGNYSNYTIVEVEVLCSLNVIVIGVIALLLAHLLQNLQETSEFEDRV